MLALLAPQLHNHADHAGALGAQAPCHLVGAEAMFVGDGLDFLASFPVDQRFARQRARHGTSRYAGHPRQFGDVPDAVARHQAAHAGISKLSLDLITG